VRAGIVLLVSVLPTGDDIDGLDRRPVIIVAGSDTWTGWSSFYRSF
jgi:hypothetical protein